MSLKLLIQDQLKKWLNIRVNECTCDGLTRINGNLVVTGDNDFTITGGNFIYGDNVIDNNFSWLTMSGTLTFSQTEGGPSIGSCNIYIYSRYISNLGDLQLNQCNVVISSATITPSSTSSKFYVKMTVTSGTFNPPNSPVGMSCVITDSPITGIAAIGSIIFTNNLTVGSDLFVTNSNLTATVGYTLNGASCSYLGIY